MAENVPIQPLNRLSLPIFHVTNSGLKKKTQESMLQSVNFNNATQIMAVIETGYTGSIFFDTTFNPPRDVSFSPKHHHLSSCGNITFYI